MVLSRFWYVLLGLLFGASLFLLHIASSMYNRSGLRARAEGLSADAQVVSWYLRDTRASARRSSSRSRSSRRSASSSSARTSRRRRSRTTRA